MLRVRERQTDRLLRLTPCCNTHIQSLASCLFRENLIQCRFVNPEATAAPLPHLWLACQLCWLPTPIDWPPRLTPGSKNFRHYIFSERPRIFSSGAIHVIHFSCPLFTLRHSCILFTKSTLTGCQRSICNTFTLSAQSVLVKKRAVLIIILNCIWRRGSCSGKCWVPVYCYYSQVLSDPEC